MTGPDRGRSGLSRVLHCDVLCNLGPISPGVSFIPKKAKTIQIDIEPTHLGRRHPVTIGAIEASRRRLRPCSLGFIRNRFFVPR